METGCIPRLWMLKPKVITKRCTVKISEKTKRCTVKVSELTMAIGLFLSTSKDRVGVCCVYFEIFSNSDETISVKTGLVKNRQKNA
jgi:hypothetical protein